MKFKDIPQMTRFPAYRVNISWRFLPEWLEGLKKDSRPDLDLDPDFQRAHVWAESQQRRYVEFVLRGGQSSKDLYFNCPGWQGDYRGPFVLVDGKQRLTAVTKFLNDELAVFDGHKISDFEDKLSYIGPDFIVHVNNLETRAEVLQWYLDLNDGGVAHTSEEIEKVKALLEKE